MLLRKAAIIGALLILLSGCSALRVTYASAPTLVWWWLDGYVDFGREQALRAQAAVEGWFDWHRSTQLPAYAALLGAAQAQVLEPVTAEGACRHWQQWRDALDPAVERALQTSADFVPGLGEAQWRHMEQRFAKKNAELRRDFLQPDLDERRRAAVKRAAERAEMLYGDIDEPQLRLVEAGVAASPFDPQAWIAERERRQRDTLQTLRRLAGEGADHDRIVAALRALVDRVERSPDPRYRAYQQNLSEYNCALAARIHNATSPAQREAARARLKGWEDDLRQLARSAR